MCHTEKRHRFVNRQLRLYEMLQYVATIVMLQIISTGAEMYCEDESFAARCGEGEVIVIQSAMYGRMRIGRCISDEFRKHMGCANDVIAELDQWCSGRRQCNVQVKQLIGGRVRCEPKEIRTYLEASYECLKVISPTEGGCSYGNPATSISASIPSTGYVSSYTTSLTGCGSIDTPWKLSARKGQRLNITLMDFAVRQTTVAEASTGTCSVRAIIKDAAKDSSAGSGGNGRVIVKPHTVCTGRRRIEQVFSSGTNELELRIIPKRQQDVEEAHFLLRYDVVGCPDPLLGDNMLSQRRGDDEVVVRCRGPDRPHEWKLTCIGTKLTGDLGSCTNDYILPASSKSIGISLTKELSIILISGIALIIALIIFGVGLICLRRMYTKEARPAHTLYGGTDMMKDEFRLNPTTIISCPSYTPCEIAQSDDFYSGNAYCRTLQAQQQTQQQRRASCGRNNNYPYSTSSDETSNYTLRHQQEHLYESPKFEASSDMNDVVNVADDTSSRDQAKYFELERVHVLPPPRRVRDVYMSVTSE